MWIPDGDHTELQRSWRFSTPPHLDVVDHLSDDEVLQRFRQCRDVDEKLRWQAVLLKLEGRASADIADACKRREDWVRRTVRKYNAEGPEGLADGRKRNGNKKLLSEDQMNELEKVLDGPSPDGGLWTGPKVARWCQTEFGIEMSPDAGRDYMKRLGFSLQRPRPKHPEADIEAHEAFKKEGFKAIFETSFENTPTQ